MAQENYQNLLIIIVLRRARVQILLIDFNFEANKIFKSK